ncbi:MAG: hypothetical protein IPG20_16645 [Gammaproteobacteria bacterium]|nr:hypothetical protein [Gammaproteobacteria bacterium]
MQARQERYYEDVHEGMEIAPVSRTVTTKQMFLYSAVTRNAHRIHYEEKFAHAEGLPAVLVQGPLQEPSFRPTSPTGWGRAVF